MNILFKSTTWLSSARRRRGRNSCVRLLRAPRNCGRRPSFGIPTYTSWATGQLWSTLSFSMRRPTLCLHDIQKARSLRRERIWAALLPSPARPTPVTMSSTTLSVSTGANGTFFHELLIAYRGTGGYDDEFLDTAPPLPLPYTTCMANPFLLWTAFSSCQEHPPPHQGRP